MTNGVWSAPTTGPAAIYRSMAYLACPTVTLCVAVDYQGNYVTRTGRGWSRVRPVLASNHGGIPSVTSVSSRFCLIIDSRDQALAWNGSRWRRTGTVGTSTFVRADCASTPSVAW